MKYFTRILRALALVLLFPFIVAVFFVGLASMPLVYGTICIYFYVKDGDSFNSKEADYYTDVVFHFFMEWIWDYPRKYILKLK
jgi:hypothetical protein